MKGKAPRARRRWVIPAVAASVALAVAVVAVVFFARRQKASAVQVVPDREAPVQSDAAPNEVNTDDLFTIPAAVQGR